MFEAYSVAIRVSLINGVTNGLVALSRQFRGADQDAKGLQRSLDKIAKTAAIGAAMTATGGAGLALLGKAVSASKEYASQLSMLNQLGMSQANIAAGVKAAWQTAFDVPTTRVEQNLQTLRELRSAFGPSAYQEAEARMLLPVAQRVAGVLSAVKGAPQEHVGFDMVKAAELRTLGGMTPEAMKRNADLMSRTILAMGGTITAADFHGAFKMGKMATGKWSDEFAYLYLPTLMQELRTGAGGGAQSAGTILMSLYQQMHGKMTKASMPLWVQAGLVKPGDIVKNATGQYQVKPGAVAGTALFESDPYLWVQKYLRPGVDRLMKTQGITAETAINAMFSNRNAAFGAYTFYAKAVQFERDRKLIEQTNGLGAYNALLKTNPMLAEQALQSQLHNQLVIVGYSILPDLVKVMGDLLPYLKNFTSYLREHPRLVAGVTKAFGVLSAVVGAAGLLTTLSAGFSALKTFFGLFRASGPVATSMPVVGTAFRAIGTALIGLGEALGGWLLPILAGLVAIGGAIVFVARGWEKNKSSWQNVKDGLNDYWSWIVGLGRDALAKIRKWETPGKGARWDDRVGAKLLTFVDGLAGGLIRQLQAYYVDAKKIAGQFTPLWTSITSGLTGFIGGLKAVADEAHRLLPFLFPGGKPAESKAQGAGGLDWRKIGRDAGKKGAGSMLDIAGHSFGFDYLRNGVNAYDEWTAVARGLGAGRKATVPPPRTESKQPIHTTVQIDGRTVAKAVSFHQERDMERASRSSASGVDPRRALLPVGMTAA